MSQPVSLGMPVYNAARYIEETLDALLAQTMAEFELTISDNGSTDATAAICRSYARRDDRVNYHRHDRNRGAAWNHNFVFRHSTGEFFKWTAYDDICAPTFLERCVAALRGVPEAAVAYPLTKVLDETTGAAHEYTACPPWEPGPPSRRLANLLGPRYGNSLLHKCFPIYGLMRSSVLRSTGLIRAYPSSDNVLLVELAARGEFVEVPESLFVSRWHARSSMVANATAGEVAAWYDPRIDAERFPMPRTRLLLGYLDAVRRAPMSTRERSACLRVIGRWLTQDRVWQVIGGEIKIKAREIVR